MNQNKMEQWQLNEIEETRQEALRNGGAWVTFVYAGEALLCTVRYKDGGFEPKIISMELHKQKDLLENIEYVAKQVYKDFKAEEESLLFVPINQQFVFSWRRAPAFDIVGVLVPGMLEDEV